ncbi:MAG: hypothetical protein WBQ50_09985 [Nocardioides sp.]
MTHPDDGTAAHPMPPVRPPRDRLGAAASLAMMGWLTVVLWLDRDGGAGTMWTQRGAGLLTWAVLLVALTRVSPVVRAQTAVVVVFATIVELTFSAGLEVYTYRFDNVPAYVPPGHGLVYLSAFALGHAAFVQRRLRAAEAAVLLVGGTWAGYGLLLADRPDALGAFWFLCLAGFLAWGPSKQVYVGAFVVVSWLELAGTALGTWVWGTHDFTGWITIGNPPSGAAGGYGWFDLAGLLLAPALLRLVSRARRGRRPALAEDPEPGAADVH